MERLQPEREFEPNPDAEDEAHDEHAQRQVDDAWHAETLLRQQLQESQK